MVKKRHILQAGLVIAVVCGLVGLALRPREPRYEGKTLSIWLDQYGSNHWMHHDGDLDKEAQAALQHMGTNAAPNLLKMMSSRESSFKTNVLGRVPQSWLVLLHLPTVNEYQNQVGECRRRGAFGFSALGPDAKPFIPALVRLLQDTNYDVRYVAVFALRCLGPVAREALPSLIKCLDDPEFTVRDDAVMSLGIIHEDPEHVVPLLRSFIEKNRGSVILCQDAMQALGSFGKEAASAAPVLLPFLNDKDSNTRSRATNTLKAIDPEAAAKFRVP